jgi:hypothetical protein
MTQYLWADGLGLGFDLGLACEANEMSGGLGGRMQPHPRKNAVAHSCMGKKRYLKSFLLAWVLVFGLGLGFWSWVFVLGLGLGSCVLFLLFVFGG